MRPLALMALTLGVAGAAAPHGSLTRLHETRAPCLDWVAPPDGRNLYSACGVDRHSSKVVVLRRDPATGRVSLVPNACSFHCSYADGLNNPSEVAMTPDGRDLIVGNRSGVHPVSVYRRGAGGRLRMTACVGADLRGFPCTKGDVGGFMDFAVSPDGRNLYVAHVVSVRVVANFRRNPATGRLAQPPGATGCIAPAGSTYNDCGHAPSAKFRPGDVTVSPDGRNVYVGSGTEDGVRGIFAFARDASTGALTPLAAPSACFVSRPTPGCETVPGIVGVADVDPGGRHLYAARHVFARNASTGALTLLPRQGAAGPVAFSPDGRTAYEGGSRFLRVYRRQADGGLILLPSPYGVIRRKDSTMPLPTADGRHVYASGIPFTAYRVGR
jgi:DNA-binding beta-propeller fold protein YncE